MNFTSKWTKFSNVPNYDPIFPNIKQIQVVHSLLRVMHIANWRIRCRSVYQNVLKAFVGRTSFTTVIYTLKVDHKDFAVRLRDWMFHGFTELGDNGGLGIGSSTLQTLCHPEFLKNPHKVFFLYLLTGMYAGKMSNFWLHLQY